VVNHRRDEMFERCGWIAATAGMNWRGLNDRATGRDEPVETLALR
jgi:hypothetical protein